MNLWDVLRRVLGRHSYQQSEQMPPRIRHSTSDSEAQETLEKLAKIAEDFDWVGGTDTEEEDRGGWTK